MNPWHTVDVGKKSPEVVTAIIEIPKGSKTKYELDKDTGLIKVDRVLYGSMHYPANYGFIPKSYCEDCDPLDVLVLGQATVYPLSLMNAKAIGVIKMVDQGEQDDKIIAVHADDPEFRDYNDIAELPKHVIKTLKNFFEDYKNLEEKEVIVTDVLGKNEAIKVIKEAFELYENNKEKLIK